MNDKMEPSQLKLSPGGLQPRQSGQTNRTVRTVAIAVAVVLALLGGLAAYETLNRDAPPPSARPAAPPPAAQTATVESAPAPAVTEEPKAEPAPAPAEAPKDESVAPRVPQPEQPVAAGRSKGDAVPGKATEPRPRTAERPQLAAAAPAAPGARPDTRAAGAPGAWFVQAGVFNNLANAEAMRDKLATNGFPAVLEVRVLAGPYPDRDEAQRAQRRLGELGIAPTLLVPARKPASPPPGR